LTNWATGHPLGEHTLFTLDVLVVFVIHVFNLLSVKQGGESRGQ